MLDTILEFNDGPVKYEKSGRGHIKMVGHGVPLSIMQEEWDFLHNTIVDNDLQRGFELATAFGISGSAIGAVGSSSPLRTGNIHDYRLGVARLAAAG